MINFKQQSRHPKQHLTQQTTIFVITLDSTIFSNFLQKYSNITLINEITAIKKEPNARDPI